MPANLWFHLRHSSLVPSVALAEEPASSIPLCNKNLALRGASQGLAGTLLVKTSINLFYYQPRKLINYRGITRLLNWYFSTLG